MEQKQSKKSDTLHEKQSTARKRAYEMAEFAYRTVPLYYNMAEKSGLTVGTQEWEDIPIVDKSFYIQAGSSISSEYMGKYIQGKLHLGRTSGSTGKFSEVYWDFAEEKRSMASLWLLRRRYYGISPQDRLCYFYPADQGGIEVYREKNRCAFSKLCLLDQKLEECYRQILEFNPVWMILQPSVAWLLCRLIREKDLPTPSALSYIEFTGEYLEEQIRQETRAIFHCQTANQYGAEEVNSIAYECPEGNLHCMSANVYLETANDSAEGELCVTTLQNRAMPLVRFRIGDRGKIRPGSGCKCGNCSDILELQAGRENDWIWRKDGSQLHAYALIQLIHQLNLQLDGEILQYQMEQLEYDTFLFHLVLGEGDEEETGQALADLVRERLGEQTKVMIQFHECLIPDSRTGKLACFYSHCENHSLS